MTKQALIELRDKVAAGGGLYPSHFPPTFPKVLIAMAAHNGSLDAAVAFLEAVLPEWTVNSLHQKRHPTNGMKPTGQWECLLFAALETKFAHAEAEAGTPARALLLATLSALIEGAE